MKIRAIVLLTVALFFAGAAKAAILAWGLDTSGTDFNTTWTDANVYSYIVSGSSSSVVDTFINSWNSSYGANETSVWGGKAGVVKAIADGSYQTFDQDLGTFPKDGGYHVVIFEKGTDTIYSYASAWYTYGYTDTPEYDSVGFYIKDGYDTKSATGGEGGKWTTFTVPEPTALALLALGVAGLALKRKVA